MPTHGEASKQIIEKHMHLRDQGDDAAALEVLTEGVERFPDDPELQLFLAGMLAPDAARANEAIEAARRAASLADGDVWIRLSSASALYTLNEKDEARSILSRLSPEELVTETYLAAGALRLAAEFAWTDGEVDRAETLFRRAYATDPSAIGTGERLARFLAAHGRLDEALDVIADALDHLPGDSTLLRAQVDFEARRRARRPPRRRGGHS